MLKIVAVLLTLLVPSLAYSAASIVPAFGTISSATGGKVSSGQTGTNTLNVVGGTVSKIGTKPTLTIPAAPSASVTVVSAIVNASIDTPLSDSFFGYLDGATYKKLSYINLRSDLRGTVYDVRDYASLAEAVAAIGSTTATLQYSTDQTLTADLIIPSNIDLLPINGAKIIPNGFNLTGLKIATPEMFGAKGDGVSDDTAALQAAAKAASRIIIDRTYIASSAVTFALDNVVLEGKGTIKTSGNGYTLLKFTALRPKVSGITVEGSATEAEVIGQTPNQTANRKALIEINGEALTERQGAVIDNVTVHNAFETGIFLYKAVDVKITNCAIASDQTDSLPANTAPYVQGLYSYASAIINFTGNTVIGYGEGLVVSTDGTALVDIFDGSTPSIYTRKIIISDNIFTDQYDHSVYMSNFCSEYNISNNSLRAKDNPALKIEGDNLIVSGNAISQGITTRHIKGDATISDNDIHIYSGNEYTYGILLTTDVLTIPSYTGTDNVLISNNRLKCDAGIRTAAAIAVLGLVDGTNQRVLSNIGIYNNTAIGFGYNVAEASGILINQQLITTNPVTGTKARNVSINGNVVEMADVSGLGTPTVNYGVSLLYGVENVSVQDNTIKGYTSMAVRSLGLSYGQVAGNITASKTVTGIATRYGFYERAHDTTLHYNSANNTYGVNTFGGDGNTLDVSRADQSSVRFDLKNLTATLSLNNTYDPPRYGYQAIYINMTAASKTITLSTTGWWLNEAVTIYNTGANAFTVTNGTISKSVAVGANITFVHTGSNTFVTDK